MEGEELAADRAARPPLRLRPVCRRPARCAARGDALALVGGSIGEVRARLGGLNDALGLAPLLDRWIGDMSAGIRQRIANAAAIAGGLTLVTALHDLGTLATACNAGLILADGGVALALDQVAR